MVLTDKFVTIGGVSRSGSIAQPEGVGLKKTCLTVDKDVMFSTCRRRRSSTGRVWEFFQVCVLRGLLKVFGRRIGKS